MNRVFIECTNDSQRLFYTGGGMFFGDNPFHRAVPFNMIRLGMFYIISNTLHHFLRPLKQTEYVCNVLTAIILGPSVFGRIKAYKKMVDDPSQYNFLGLSAYIGAIYVLFLTCVKIDCHTLIRTKKQSWVIGLSSVGAPLIVMGLLVTFTHRLPLKKYFAYLTITNLSCTSFTNTASMLEELNLLTTELGQLLMSAGLTNEVVMWSFWISMMIRTNLFYTNRGYFKVALQFGAIFLALLACRVIMSRITRRMHKGQAVKEVYLTGIMVAALFMSAVTDILAGSTFLGPLALGLTIPNGPPLGSSIVLRCESFIKYGILPFFYLAVGDMVDLASNFKDADMTAHLIFQGILFAGYLTKTLATTLSAMSYNMTLVQALSLGLAMNTSGVMHVTIYYGFYTRRILLMDMTTHFVLTSLLATAVVTPLVHHFQKQCQDEDTLGLGFELSVQSAAMGSKINVLACVDSEEEVPIVIGLLNLSGLTYSHDFMGYMVHLTELDGQSTPMILAHKKHQRICGHNGCVQITGAIEKYYDDKFKSSTSLHLMTIVAPPNNMHESVCKLAQDKMIPLVIIPFLYSKNRLQSTKKVVSDDFSQRVQSRAPCSVGIMVDKGLTNRMHRSQELSQFSNSIIVLFFGGEDDREALAYAIWMCKHRNVGITLMRIVVEDYYKMDDDSEMSLDEHWVKIFRTLIHNAPPGNLMYREIHVEDWLEAVDVVKNLDNVYDLVMLGRRHGDVRTMQEEQENCILADYPELGIIGELLVTDELQWGSISVLVMQHCISSKL